MCRQNASNERVAQHVVERFIHPTVARFKFPTPPIIDSTSRNEIPYSRQGELRIQNLIPANFKMTLLNPPLIPANMIAIRDRN